ncbi:MAG: polyvinylalcohol dehydrogenase, partial [Acidobacteria bacterium]
MRHICSSLIVIGLVLGCAPIDSAPNETEWPQWRGPERTGLSKETGLLREW